MGIFLGSERNIYSKILTRGLSAFGRAPCLLASKNLEKTEVGATLGPRHRCSGPTSAPGGFETAQERSGRPQDGSESAPAGLKTAPKERSGRLQDGSKSAPEGLKTASTALRQARDGFKSALGGLKTASRAFQEAQDVPKSALGVFETTRQAFQFLKVGVSSRAPALFLEAAQRVSSSLLELLRHLRIGSASPKVGFRRYFQRSCASPLSSSPRVHEPTGPRDHGSTGPRVHEPTGPRDHGCTGPRVHGTTRPRAHGSTGPWVHEMSGQDDSAP